MNKILVTGATGNIGHKLITDLLKKGESVRALVRNPGQANLPVGVDIFKCDLEDKKSLVNALNGVEKVFLLMGEDNGRIFTSAATEAGVRHVVLLSSYSVEFNWPSRENYISKRHQEGEANLKESGLAWTFLRPSGFMTTSLPWAGTIASQGKVYLPFPESAHPPIHPHDIALSAAAVLTGEGHEGKSYTLTGPELLTRREQVKILAEILGKEISVVQIPKEKAVENLSVNMPEPMASAVIELIESAPGIFPVSQNVPSLTGTPGLDFRTWVNENKDTFL